MISAEDQAAAIEELKGRADYARALIETGKLEMAAKAVKLQRALSLRESYLQDPANYVDPREWQTDDDGRPLSAIGWGQLGATRNDREHGDNVPFFQTEAELAAIRSQARWLAGANGLGVHIMDVLTDYVIGEGFKFRFKLRDEKRDKSLAPIAKLCQRLIDRFIEDNNWQGDADREIFMRTRRDGECFPLLFGDRSGRCLLRIGEPEQCVEPSSSRDLDDRFANGRVGDWSWGVHTDADDVERVFGYYFQWTNNSADFDYLPARMVEHCKVNVDRNVKRGLSDFYPVISRLHRAEKLLRNTEEGAAVQAAIAYIVEAAQGVTRDAAESAQIQRSDYATQVIGSQSGRTQYTKKFVPGTVLTVPNGQQYKPGPMGAERAPNFMVVLQAAIRWIGNRWSMPEYLISGDASNANYASTMVAESPWVKSCKAKQHGMKTRYGNIMWRVIENAIRHGLLEDFGYWKMDRGALDKLKELLVLDIEAPQVEVRDRKAETDRRATLHREQVLSKKTWTAQEGEDYQTEQDNLATEPKPVAINPLTGQPLPAPPGQQPGQQLGQQQRPAPAQAKIAEAAAILWECY